MVRLQSMEIIEKKKLIHSAWNLDKGYLVRNFVFNNFKEAFAFMASVAVIAERLQHHPDWSNSYNRVCIKITTHDLGGLSELDFLFATEIDLLVGSSSN